MNPTLTTSALTLHDLGLAAGFGGSLFGRYALHPAVREISDERQRSQVINSAWQRFGWVNVLSTALAGATWFIGRGALSGREIDRTARRLVIAKDALVATMVVTTIGNMIGGRTLGCLAEEGRLPLESGNVPSPRTPEQARKIQRLMNVLGPVHLAATAGVIALTAILNLRAGSSHRWSLLSRVLP